MTVAVITGGRDRTPTLLEFEDVLARLLKRGATVVRHGACRGTDVAVAAWIEARSSIKVEPWPADFGGLGRRAGPVRNRAMLDGDPPDLFGEKPRPPASFLIALRGGIGTNDCTTAALAERWLPVEWIPDADEPRVWNRHHEDEKHPRPSPWIYVGRPSPLGNPWPLELREGETRAAAAAANLDRYKRWLWARIKPGQEDTAVIRELDSITDKHHLVCSCWPLHCHAEVIVAAWRWRARSLREYRGRTAVG